MKLADNQILTMSHTSTITTQRMLRIPSDMTQLFNEDAIEVYTKTVDGKMVAMGFAGKRTKPDFYYRFSTVERMYEYINNWRTNIESHNTYVKEQKEKRLQDTTLKVNDILEGTWGYEQTNVTFYQVLKVVGKRMVEIQEIGASLDWNGGPSAYSTPVPNSFKGKPERKMVSNGHYISINSYLSVTPWNGKPVSITGPGWGH